MSGVTAREAGSPWIRPREHGEPGGFCPRAARYRRAESGWPAPLRPRDRPRHRGIVTLAAAAWLVAPAPAVAQETAAALRAMESAADRYREVHAMCADFAQVIDVRLARRTIESEGRVCQQRPNLFSMRFTDPPGDMVISDGTHFWVYYPSIDEEQVMRHPAAETPGRHDFFHEFLEDPASKYTAGDGGTGQVNGRDCRIVSLTPRAGASYRRARLWLDTRNHLIRRLELHEESGNVRTVTLSNEDLSPVPDPGLFTFEVPEGARVRGAPPDAGEPPGTPESPARPVPPAFP